MMNARIRSLLASVETRLPEQDQDVLADLLEEFVSSRSGWGAEFTAEEHAHLLKVDAEAFEAADTAAVAAVFARRA